VSIDPAQLAPHYTRSRVSERVLLTGHSHQAWPDAALEGQLEAFETATRELDRKWEHAFAKAEQVRAGFRLWLGDPDAELALGASTHELVIRFLSALDLRGRPRLISTDGEFHTLRRQLGRLAETSAVEVAWVSARPVETLAARLIESADERTAAVCVSAVLFEDARIVPHLDQLAAACEQRGVELLIDAYHALGPVPFTTPASAWVTGGGYKYLQLGEGNCFLRIPAHAHDWRPVITGWYAEFEALAGTHDPRLVPYGRGAAAFAGSTYDPTSHYRAARVTEFFSDYGLTPAALQGSYRRQLARLASAFDELHADPDLITRDRLTPLEHFGGFLALRSPIAAELQRALAREGVMSDSRGAHLRLGPAPYVPDHQLDAAVAALGGALAAHSHRL
jgi:kynureninase